MLHVQQIVRIMPQRNPSLLVVMNGSCKCRWMNSARGTGPVEDKVRNTQTRFMDAEILVHRLSEKAVLPSRQSPEAAGLDLSSAEDAIVEPWSQLLVRTDSAVQKPAGTYARIASRSGLAVKHGIDVAAGVVNRD